MKRPFRGLRERPPDPAYDAVVIGAGVGGLIAANLLAKAGQKVLLAEQHYMVGGYCSTFRRSGYTFDAATHFYPLLGNPETLSGRLLADLGVTTSWVKMDPVDIFHLPDGSRFEVPADLEAYLARLKADFPAEARAIDGFFGVVRDAYLLGLLAYFRGREAGRLEGLRDLTVRQALDRWFGDERLKLLLTADCAHWGSPPGRTSFVFDSMLRLSYFLGNYYPQGGSQAFVDELARLFEERGGHLLMRSPARRILVEDGVARGVDFEVRHGQHRSSIKRVLAGAVVANGDLLHTLEELVGEEHLDPERLAVLRGLRPTFPCFLTHIGLRGVPAEVLREAQGYYWDSWDMERVGLDALRFKLFVPTLHEPAMAPEGGQIVIVQKVQELDFDGIADWERHKQEVQDFVLAHLERMIPGIGSRIVVCRSASALTSRRFTMNHQGAMLGWEMSPGQLGDMRPGIAGEVRNLYFVGHWTQPGGGITPVIVSAQRAARAVLDGREEAEPSPFAALSAERAVPFLARLGALKNDG
ncbi:MAG TPA: NAD(P)/FAD-dependent oxidoreductase [Thermoanaerobaculia bacterium]|nr:NAD(P)/FAD-dependent oxidoreductase [Thermoanaerobaculia bacterium]